MWLGKETAHNPAVPPALSSSVKANVPSRPSDLPSCTPMHSTRPLIAIKRNVHAAVTGEGVRKDGRRGCLPWRTFEKHCVGGRKDLGGEIKRRRGSALAYEVVT